MGQFGKLKGLAKKAADAAVDRVADGPLSMVRNLAGKNLIPRDLDTNNPLYHHITTGKLGDLLENKTATFDQLQKLQETNPAALTALRHDNFKDAVSRGEITVDQVGKLSPAQLEQMQGKLDRADLVREVERIAGPDPNKVAPVVEAVTPTPVARPPAP